LETRGAAQPERGQNTPARGSQVADTQAVAFPANQAPNLGHHRIGIGQQPSGFPRQSLSSDRRTNPGGSALKNLSIVTGRNPETFASAKKILSGVAVHPSDSGDLAATQALGDEVKTFADHLDGAFLNASIGTFGPFDAATPNNYDDMFNVNVRGLYLQLQSLLPLLGNPSSVVFTSSIAGSIAFAGTSIYSATKAAVISLGKTLAVELAPRGIRVNVLSPGPIDTPIIKKMGLPADQLKGFEETIVAKSVLKRWGTSHEVARAARFLPSEDSSNITGTELIIDGGVRLN
jgi:NAD(P)-dependent dehydrogenase (short-subunit alcohol dehydrogenase family)